MKDKKLEQLKKEYMNTPIPTELDYLVEMTLKKTGVNIMKNENRFRKATIVAASIAAAIVTLTVGINTSPTFAKTLSGVPIVGGLIKVLNFNEYTVNEDTFNATINTPIIDGLEDKNLENSLNEKYLADNKKLYDQFIVDMEHLKKNGEGHLGVNSGYVIKTDTDSILAVGRYVVNAVGSSSTTFMYDTIDKKNEVLITLPSLFKDDLYIDAISENIKQQMVEHYKADPNKFYWVEGIEQQGPTMLFEIISSNQNFYINSEDKLVISFDKYEVAPGYMGVVEFIIPTEVLSDSLTSSTYIK